MRPLLSPRLLRWLALPACAVLAALPYAAHAQAGPAAAAATPAPSVRLELPGTVSIHHADVATVSVTANAEVRGYTIGWSNAARRAPYRTETVRRADTYVVRPAPREALHSVGINWRSEHFEHDVRLPSNAIVVVHGASHLRVDGTESVRCAERIWILAPGVTPRCIAEGGQ